MNSPPLESMDKYFSIGADGIYGELAEDNYWSNLDKDENAALVDSLQTMSSREAIRKIRPQLEEVIFSPKRAAGLELLNLSGNELCIDYGCMWGALTIPLAQRTRFVIGVDKTRPSLKFLQARAKENGCSNIAFVQAQLRSFPEMKNRVDVAVVNGVLEWIPESGSVELNNFFNHSLKRTYETAPGVAQEQFLLKVKKNLRPGGKLYLAIENRYAYNMFLGGFDPHNGLRFTTVLPRSLASYWSLRRLGRPYVNWIYSPNQLRVLLNRAGFNRVDLYSCFPDYRYPEKIIPFSHSMSRFSPHQADAPSSTWGEIKRSLKIKLELLMFRELGFHSLAPSIIAIAHS